MRIKASDILLTAAVLLCICPTLFSGAGRYGKHRHPSPSRDTVTYTPDAYRLHRTGDFEAAQVPDSLLDKTPDSLLFTYGDTVRRLTARDTIKAPDSLRLTDPFRYKYYVALIDSATHVFIRDSLRHEEDSLLGNYYVLLDSLGGIPQADTLAATDSVAIQADTLEIPTEPEQTPEDPGQIPEDTIAVNADSIAAVAAHNDSLWNHCLADSLWAMADRSDRLQLDSTYYADSTARAKAAFEAWYWSLSKQERRKYDAEQREIAKMAVRDSLQAIKDKKQEQRDSVIKNTPRILESYAILDTMRYQKLISWTENRDFMDIEPMVADTSYNAHFYDYAWQRNDINASWLGVAGSPVQYYNWFKRGSQTGCEFVDPFDAWTYSPQTLRQYNSKAPYTELAYYGTLMSPSSQESDNVHIFTTQNITPALNYSLLYESWAGGGILINEAVKNKTFAAGLNYTGEKYMAHAGFINDNITMGENGGIWDSSMEDGGLFWVRDTTVDAREIPVANTSATSTIKKRTFYVDQQLRIPFEFINRIKMERDTTFVPDSTVELPTLFVGHGLEYSTFTRQYTASSLTDTVSQKRLDNKVYLRFQPFGHDAALAKIDLGLGDYTQKFGSYSSTGSILHPENSFYTYAGADGLIGKNLKWNATAHYVLGGDDAGNADLEGRASYVFYPWRKARRSPVTISASLDASSLRPTYFQRHYYSKINEDIRWDNSFSNVATTKMQAGISIPYWKFDASLGYGLVSNYVYHDTLGVARQNTAPINILSAYMRKEFVVGDILHLDNRLLLQHSSDRDVLDLPLATANLKYYIEFVVQKNETKTANVMTMQIGVDTHCNTKWYSPAWNPVTGTFCNQNEWQYRNGPWFDVFMNVQWKNCCIFIKAQNLGQGWPADHADYFSAHRHIVTEGGTTGLKLGIWWPFGMSTTENKKAL